MSPLSRGRGRHLPAAPAVLGALCVLLGVVLMVVAFLGQVPRPPSPGSAEAPVPSTDVVGTTPAETSVAAGADAEPSTTTARDAAEPSDVGLARSEPTTVRVPAIGVDSPLHALGLGEDGTLLVPTGERVDEAAWYSGSPTPGEAGPSVIEGHVTGASGRPSVFFRLGELRVGDRVQVDRTDGRTAHFEVYGVESHPKDRFPTVRVYGNTDQPELRLITCGGELDPTSGHHVDNTVVFARLVPEG